MIRNRWTPTQLSDIVGQPCIRHLQTFVAAPRPRCFLLEGEPGIGKSATAYALAHELGADDGSWGGGYLKTLSASELSIEQCRDLFEKALRLSFKNWKVLVIEELDGIASKQVERYLKVALDKLPNKVVVIATSNGAGKLDTALLDRFRFLAFSSGQQFREACQKRLMEIWRAETDGADMPVGWKTWGVVGDRFSMRQALSQLEDALGDLADRP